MKIGYGVSLFLIIILIIQLPVVFAEWKPKDININEYNVAAGRIPEYPGVLNVSLTPLNSPGLFFYDMEDEKVHNKSGYESINFSVNNNNKIPANSFVYRTSRYKNDYGGFDIAWLGQLYHVIDQNETTIIISRWLVQPDSIKRTLADGETYILPEGFSIKVVELDPKKGSARFLMVRNSEKIDDKVLKVNDVYEYKLDLNGSCRNDNLVMRFKLAGVFFGTEIDVVFIKELQLISPEAVKINNNGTIIFPFEDSIISLSGKGYKVIDHSESIINISRVLVDRKNTYVLTKGDSMVLPEGFNITLLDSLSITKNGKEINNRTVSPGERFEYNVVLNGDRHSILRFKVEDIQGNSEKIIIRSVRLISPDIIEIAEHRRINFTSESYNTNIEDNGKTIKVTSGVDIELINGVPALFMGNWFSVEEQSGVVTISNEFKMPDKSERTGATGIPDKKEKIGQIGDLEIIRSVTEETIAKKTTGFETVFAMAMLLAIIFMELKKIK